MAPLVCRRWRRVSQDSSLWAHFDLWSLATSEVLPLKQGLSTLSPSVLNVFNRFAATIIDRMNFWIDSLALHRHRMFRDIQSLSFALPPPLYSHSFSKSLHLSPSHISRALAWAPRIVSLDFSFQSEVIDDEFVGDIIADSACAMPCGVPASEGVVGTQMLQHIKLKFCHNFSASTLCSVSFAAWIVSLELCGCQQLKGSDWAIILKSFRKLVHLTARWTNFDQEAFAGTYESPLTLQVLDLCDCQHVADKCTKLIFQCCPELKILKLSGCINITDEAFCSTMPHYGISHPFSPPSVTSTDSDLLSVLQESNALPCHPLIELHLDRCVHVSGDAVSHHISVAFSNLRIMKLDGLILLDLPSTLKAITRLPNLTLLSLNGCTRVLRDLVKRCNSSDALCLHRVAHILTPQTQRFLRAFPQGVSTAMPTCYTMHDWSYRRMK